MSAFQSIARQLDLPPLDFKLNEQSRGKIMRASVLPLLVVSAAAVKLALDLIYGQFQLAAIDPEFGSNPEPWSHVYRFAIGVGSLQPVALAALFFFGIGRWSRAEGAWLLLLGIVLAAVAAALGVYATVVYLLADSSDSRQDWRLFSFSQTAATVGFIAIGYFFLAYRGLASHSPYRRRRFTRRRPPQESPGD